MSFFVEYKFQFVTKTHLDRLYENVCHLNTKTN